jgi:hypothetical protein
MPVPAAPGRHERATERLTAADARFDGRLAPPIALLTAAGTSTWLMPDESSTSFAVNT